MGLNDTVRKALAVADSVTATLQTTVRHAAWAGADKYGKPIFDKYVERQAIVERRTAAVGGTQITQAATVNFLRPIEDHGADYRQEPIDPRDKIVLDDGWSGPIVNVSTLHNPTTSRGYYYIVSLGNPGGAA
jgi:hypothetical protein